MTTGHPEAKAQHYIPNFYLKGFTDSNGDLWVYEKFKPPRASKAKNEGHKPDYYTHAEHGQRDETAEDTLAEIESRAAPVLRKFTSPQFNPSGEQMGHVYLFVAFMFARVPSWREYLNKLLGKIAKKEHLKYARDKARFYRRCEEIERVTGKPLNIGHEQLRQFILQGNFEIEQASTAFNLASMIKSALNVVEELQNYSYEVLYAPETMFFFTSDSPVVTLRPEKGKQASIGMGFAWPDLEVYFPLNKRACLRLKRQIAPDLLITSKSRFDQINRVTMINATRHLYASEGYRKTARLFDQCGCKVEPGENAFLMTRSQFKAKR